jgi:hypothetical protein
MFLSIVPTLEMNIAITSSNKLFSSVLLSVSYLCQALSLSKASTASFKAAADSK